jgi:nucleoside-diphosphate-sugar epimerase
MRVVVLGATGNVGASLVESLVGDPAVDSVLGVARRRPAWDLAKTEWATADVAHDDLVPLLDGADVVVHLAWLFQPTHDLVATWRANVLGSLRVLDAVAAAAVPAVVYASSVGAYSPGPNDSRVDESWPTHGWPGAGYTREKAYVERVLDAFELGHPECRVVRLRPAFIFRRESAAEQRRLFLGPLLPHWLVRPGLLPVVPDIPGLRFQALHTADAAQAYRLAALRPVHGAFNIAADPVIDGQRIGELLGARPVQVPTPAVRGLLALAWHAHLVPASPHLFDAVLRLPIMDTTRARAELGWSPRHDSLEALHEIVEGLGAGAGMATPPLSATAGGPGRIKEFLTGIGQRA